jgi:hypothetical protein
VEPKPAHQTMKFWQYTTAVPLQYTTASQAKIKQFSRFFKVIWHEISHLKLSWHKQANCANLHNNGRPVIFVNNQLDAQFYLMYVYFYSLHVSGSPVPIIRRINCINMISGICHSVQMTVWCASLDETQSHPNLHTKQSSVQSDIYQMY